jgi:hypothetical protein
LLAEHGRESGQLWCLFPVYSPREYFRSLSSCEYFLFNQGIFQMNDTGNDAEALDGLIERWAAKIKRSSSTTVEGILMQAENVLEALRELRPHGPKARQLLQARARLSQPMISKLEAVGRHAALMRLRASRLPPSISSLYVLTRKPWRQFLKAIEIDLRGMSRVELQQLFVPPAQPRRMSRLMAISIPHDLSGTARQELIIDIRAALGQISEARGIDLGLSLSRERRASPIPAPPSCHRRGPI